MQRRWSTYCFDRGGNGCMAISRKIGSVHSPCSFFIGARPGITGRDSWQARMHYWQKTIFRTPISASPGPRTPWISTESEACGHAGASYLSQNGSCQIRQKDNRGARTDFNLILNQSSHLKSGTASVEMPSSVATWVLINTSYEVVANLE